jgi:hypothetical protein
MDTFIPQTRTLYRDGVAWVAIEDEAGEEIMFPVSEAADLGRFLLRLQP